MVENNLWLALFKIAIGYDMEEELSNFLEASEKVLNVEDVESLERNWFTFGMRELLWSHEQLMSILQ